MRTFQGKYGGLPGDIPNPYASQFGFQPRGTLAGQGDGNGIIEAENSCGSSGTSNGYANGCGELAVFWEDLSEAGLIDATIQGSDTAGLNYPSITTNSNITPTTTPNLNAYFPQAKMGQGNYVYLYSMSGLNFFAVSSVTLKNWMVQSTANPGLTVLQAYNIDSKVDDGLPESGTINACYTNYNAGGFHYGYAWAAGGLNAGGNGAQGCAVTTGAVAPQTYNCFDNGGIAGVQKYALSNANIANCALSFRFQ